MTSVYLLVLRSVQMIQAIECGSKSPYIHRPVTYWIDEKSMCIVYPEESEQQSTLEDLIIKSLGVGASEKIVLLVLEHVRPLWLTLWHGIQMLEHSCFVTFS